MYKGNCCVVPNEKTNTAIITGMYGCEIERVLFQGISRRTEEIIKTAVRTTRLRG
jgi:phage baseplate assembly protein W